MNIRSIITTEIIKGDRSYTLSLQQGSPWEEIYTVLDQFIVDLKELEKKSLEQATNATAQEQATDQSIDAPCEACAHEGAPVTTDLG